MSKRIVSLLRELAVGTQVLEPSLIYLSRTRRRPQRGVANNSMHDSSNIPSFAWWCLPMRLQKSASCFQHRGDPDKIIQTEARTQNSSTWQFDTRCLHTSDAALALYGNSGIEHWHTSPRRVGRFFNCVEAFEPICMPPARLAHMPGLQASSGTHMQVLACAVQN